MSEELQDKPACAFATRAGDGWLFCKKCTSFQKAKECTTCPDYHPLTTEYATTTHLRQVCEHFVASYKGEPGAKSLKEIYDEAVAALK